MSAYVEHGAYASRSPKAYFTLYGCSYMHVFIALWYRAWQVACPETTSNGHC